MHALFEGEGGGGMTQESAGLAGDSKLLLLIPRQ